MQMLVKLEMGATFQHRLQVAPFYKWIHTVQYEAPVRACMYGLIKQIWSVHTLSTIQKYVSRVQQAKVSI